MIKELTVGDRILTYEFERKKVKNINIRVRRDKSVYVSCGFGVPERDVIRFINEKSDFIFSVLERDIPEDKPVLPLRDGSTIMYLGKPVVIRTSDGHERMTHSENTLYLSCRTSLDKAFLEWQRKEAQRIITQLCEAVYPEYSLICPSFPIIKFRRMKTRWGSCQPKKRVLTFNTALTEMPPQCIEYVVHHEFVHFLHPNHSKAFYDELTLHLPDWKKRRQLLKIQAK